MRHIWSNAGCSGLSRAITKHHQSCHFSLVSYNWMLKAPACCSRGALEISERLMMAPSQAPSAMPDLLFRGA